jgi:3-deoxy-D-manno-octulosonate 8-phosphate phosphatase (KDO 8-P phosphatase)
VLERLKGLGIQYIYLGQSHKMDAFEEALHAWELTPADIAYMGDDYPDLPVLEKVGLPCAPADACAEVRSIAHFISTVNGGMGCARDLIEKVMKVQGTWDNADSHQW